MINYYLLFVEDDINPEIIGPFSSASTRDMAAIEFRGGRGIAHGYFPLDVDNDGKPTIDTYSGGFFMDLGDD